MRLACWLALGVCLGCSAGSKLGDTDRTGAGGGAGSSGTGGVGMMGKGGSSPGVGGSGGSGNTSSGNGGSGNASSGSGGTMMSPGVGVSALTACTDPGIVGVTPVRRLSQLEYANAIRDLFGITIDPSDLPSDELLDNVFTANVTTQLTTDQFTRYDNKAQTVADQVAAGIATASSCAATDATCIQSYLAGKARQAFHGVLEPDDQKTLADLYTATAMDDATLAASTAVHFILDSPRFLYVIEFGTTDGKLARLSPGELAGRLASFLWRSVPDTALLAAADSGALATEDGIRTQATRLFQDAKAEPVLREFADEWLGLSPTGSDAAGQAIDAETGDVFSTLAHGTGTYADLFTSTQSQGPAALASFYGVTANADGSMTLPANRAGLLLRASFMRSHIKGKLGSPTKRGKQIRQALLCDPVAAPGNVDMSVPDPMNGQTTQDVFNQHASDPKCSGCHSLMDPIGAAFGTYGPDGLFDTALATTTAGVINPGNSNDFSATFADTAGLMTALSTGTVPQQCFAIQTLRFALGRNESTADACGLADIWQGFQDGNLSLQTLFVEVATSSLMQVRNIVHAGEACQ